MRSHVAAMTLRVIAVLVLVLAGDAVDARPASALPSPARRGVAPRPPAVGSPGPRQGRVAAPRKTPRPASSSLRQVERLLDSTGWGWRQAGVTVRIGYYAGQCCHQGTYHFASRTMWIGPTAFRSPRRLRYVALHELAHGWQSIPTHLRTVRADMRRWGRSGMSAIEAHADCMAALWGAGRGHYWDCPPDARILAGRRLAGDRG